MEKIPYLILLSRGGTNLLVLFAIVLGIFWVWKMHQKKIEWFSQHIAPENPRTERNISEDVLIYDFDNDCNLIAYYCYNESKWCFINYQDTPINFKWRYFDIDIDEP